MPRTITVSLPVADLNVSKAFYTACGFVNNPQFTDDTAAMMVWSETINVMLLTHAKWRTFTTRPIPPKTSSEVALHISCDSREDVDAMNKAALENGGTPDINPVEDHGSMYGRDFADPDGHIWGAMWISEMQSYDLAIPTLPCRSVSATVEFYERLGFEGGAHAFNGDYAILRRGAVELHFFTHKELVPEESSSGCYVRVLDVESVYRSFSSSRLPRTGIPRMDTLEDKPWGLREFAVVDPDGNLLRIGQSITK